MIKFVIKSEVTKFFSFSWCVWGLIGSILLAPVLLALANPLTGSTMETHETMSMILRNFYITQAGLVVLSASFFGQEYNNSYLRTSLLSVPSRWKLIFSKVFVLTSIVILISILSTLLCLVVGYVQGNVLLTPTILQKLFLDVSISMVSWILISWITAALSVITKSLIAPIAIMFPFILGLSQMLLAMTDVFKYLPDLATMNVFFDSAITTMLSINNGILVQITWSIVIGVIGIQLLKRRDVR